ncbi:MAG: hypothetical protein JWO78_2025 [Micavibrio sp.]|nr:hypothetical protein [Micavibrio sp.]
MGIEQIPVSNPKTIGKIGLTLRLILSSYLSCLLLIAGLYIRDHYRMIGHQNDLLILFMVLTAGYLLFLPGILLFGCPSSFYIFDRYKKNPAIWIICGAICSACYGWALAHMINLQNCIPLGAIAGSITGVLMYLLCRNKVWHAKDVTYEKEVRKKTLLMLTPLIIIIVTIIGGFKLWEYKFRLSFIPNEFGVYKIIYRNEDSWGFGPGGNETGFIVYELPEKIAKKIETEGISYLQNLYSNARDGHEWRGHYETWHETPIDVTRNWVDYMSMKDGEENYSKKTPSIENYLNAYGFGISIDSQFLKIANSAIVHPKNYYAYGRIGIIIIIPASRKIIYAYNG